MNMIVGKRILVIGCSGAGKSTLSKQLASITGLPLVHLDKLYWKPGWQACAKEEIDQKIIAALSAPEWIIDGNFNRTLEMRLKKCDTVIFMDYSRFACLMGCLVRRIVNNGKTRDDMGEGCVERLDWSFIKYIWSFRKTRAPQYRILLKDYGNKGVSVITLQNHKQAKAWLREIKQAA